MLGRMTRALIAAAGCALGCAPDFGASSARAESSEIPDPNYHGLRYTDDATPFADPARRTDIWGKLKYYPIGETEWGPIYLSLGGEVRERFKSYAHQNFGFKAPPTDAYGLERLQLDADLHVTNYFRFFAQFSNNDRFGGRGVTSTTDTDRGDFTQAFADVRLPIPSATRRRCVRVARNCCLVTND